MNESSNSRVFALIRWGVLGVLALALVGGAYFVFRPKSDLPTPQVVPTPTALQLNQTFQAQNGLFQMMLPEGWSVEESSNLPLQTTMVVRQGTYSLEVTYVTSAMNLSVLPPKICDFSGTPVDGSIGLGLGRLFTTEYREFAQSAVPREAVEGQPAVVSICSRAPGEENYTFGWNETGLVSLRYLNSTGVLTEGDLIPLYAMLETLRPL